MSGKKQYEEKVEKVLKEVERIFLHEAATAHGVEIVVNMGVGELTSVTFTIKEKAVI